MSEVTSAPGKCVIVLDETLPPGKAANAAAVIALTIGQRYPELVGAPLVDASGTRHPGLIPIGIAVLSGSAQQMFSLRDKALTETGIDIVDFPTQGQQTKNYTEFLDAVAGLQPDEMKYLGVALTGNKKRIAKLVAELNLFQ